MTAPMMEASLCAAARKQWDRLKICRHPDGTPWLLGHGRYGKVITSSRACGCTDHSLTGCMGTLWETPCITFIQRALSNCQNTIVRWDCQNTYQRRWLHAQVYKAKLNRTRDVAVKTFIHQGTDPEVIRFNAVGPSTPVPLKCLCCHCYVDEMAPDQAHVLPKYNFRKSTRCMCVRCMKAVQFYR